MMSQPQEVLPEASEFLFWPPSSQVWGYRIVDRLFATRTIERGVSTRVLPYGVAIEPHYRAGEQSLDVADFMRRNHVAGLLVLRQGQIVLERYGLGLRAADRWSTMSTVKSMTAMLVGAAVNDGAISSLDDSVVRYLPTLRGSAYDDVTVRHLLTMSSGTRWVENYSDPQSDVNRYSKSLANKVPGGVLQMMRLLPRDHEPGEVFHYNTGDTYLLGALVCAATKKSLAVYMSEKIWRPCGMEFDAFYTLESEGGQEIGGSRAGMALRDFARFGEFVLKDGVIDGIRVLPEGWVDTASQSHYAVVEPQFRRYGVSGYGYSWWIGADGAMNAIGHAGQRIHIDRRNELVVVVLSALPQPPYATERDAESATETVQLLQAIQMLCVA
ncbi:MAG: hypothetical protein LKCHEGNO_01310 [Burkholderiaceae bacterium]|nr:hypothetical protein [Burkholderiaceae bacterium]